MQFKIQSATNRRYFDIKDFQTLEELEQYTKEISNNHDKIDHDNYGWGKTQKWLNIPQIIVDFREKEITIYNYYVE